MVKGPFPNEKYSKIMQYYQNFHSYPLILISKWSICLLKISQNGTKNKPLKQKSLKPLKAGNQFMVHIWTSNIPFFFNSK